jgi:hypothetical protein
LTIYRKLGILGHKVKESDMDSYDLLLDIIKANGLEETLATICNIVLHDPDSIDENATSRMEREYDLATQISSML